MQKDNGMSESKLAKYMCGILSHNQKYIKLWTRAPWHIKEGILIGITKHIDI